MHLITFLMLHTGKASIFRTKSLRLIWGQNNSNLGVSTFFFFFLLEGAKLSCSMCRQMNLFEIRSTRLINSCLPAVQEYALSFFADFILMTGSFQTSYTHCLPTCFAYSNKRVHSCSIWFVYVRVCVHCVPWFKKKNLMNEFLNVLYAEDVGCAFKFHSWSILNRIYVSYCPVECC